MKKQFILITLICSFFYLSKAQNLNLEQLGHLDYELELSDIWAYSANEKEYALVGVNNGLSIVDVTSTEETSLGPVELHFLGGASSTWRDIKTYKDHAYVTNETGDGVMIVDLTKLPEEAPFINFTGDSIPFLSAHNVFIDEFGFMYIVGANVEPGGALIYDLNKDLKTPELVGIYNDNYIHDAYVRDNIMYSCEGNRFAIVDVSDKLNWKILGTQKTFGYAHNGWLSDDSKTLFTTDETAGTWIVAWDISDPADIKELSRAQSSPGENVIPHNTHVLNDFTITSYYTDGVVIHDVSQPNALIEVGNFDTSLNYSGSGFNGCWGTTPFLPSGNILATDIETGLYVLKPTYKRAAFLSGVITDSETTEGLQDVTISILNTTATASSEFGGSYITGIANDTLVEVEFSKPGYVTATESIQLSSGTTSMLDIALQSKPTFAINVGVFDKGTGEPVPNAKIIIENNEFEFNEVFDAEGKLKIDAFYEGSYNITVGSWGHQTKLYENISFAETKTAFSANIEPGYYDDFALDFGWQVSGDAETGTWERGNPVGTSFRGRPANPDMDVDGDISNSCYVTGNGGGNAGADDIDDGNTILTSPVFDLSKANAPTIGCSTWFFNDGGEGMAPNDLFTITLSNGTDIVDLEVIDANSDGNGSWVDKIFLLSDFDIELTENMTLILETGDMPDGHLVEAAFDHFFIDDMTTGIVNNSYKNLSVQLSANPFSNHVQLTLNDAFDQFSNNLNIQFTSIDGKILSTKSINNATVVWGKSVPKGIYQYLISNGNEYLYTGKIIKIK